MSAQHYIRLNVKIERETDPELFDLLSGMSKKENRVRRLINLATYGMFNGRAYIEHTGLPVHPTIENPKKQSLEAEESEELGDIFK